MALELPPLPYAYDALQPFMSKETLEFHHDKHHAAYVNKGNELLAGSGLESKPIEDIIAAAWKDKKMPIFNNAGQVWNHTFFWNGMKPNGGGKSIPGALAARIDSDLGGYDKFRAGFVEACVTQFGSGWGWLVIDNATGKLELFKTPNAEPPFIHGKTPLLTCDVWEHAYYIDYRNLRPKYIEAFLDSLVNWEFVLEQLEKGPMKLAA